MRPVAAQVHNCFWVKDVAGRKLSDKQAELVAERLTDFVMYCTPDTSLMQAETFGQGGPISVGAPPPSPPFLPHHVLSDCSRP